MTLANLKALCAAYHLKTASDLTVNTVDLFLAAANNARRSAERLHDFEFTRILATLDIDGDTGGRLSDAVFSATDTQSVTVSTGGTPNVAGTYVYGGVFAGYAYFLLAGATTYFLFYNTAHECYIIATQLFAGDNSAAEFLDGSPGSLGGTFGAVGTYSGSVTVTFNTINTFSKIKQITNVLRTSADGQVLPLDFRSFDIAIEGTRTEIEVSDYYSPDFRYPSDATFLAQQQGSLVVQRNKTLFIYPQATTTTDPLSVTLEGYGWLADYTAASLLDTSPSDFLIEFGADYFQWSIICELNYLFKTFVPRSEGNIGTPENLKAEALRNLIIWDSYQISANTTHSR